MEEEEEEEANVNRLFLLLQYQSNVAPENYVSKSG